MMIGVILSAGMGKRMGTDKPKQYLIVNEKPILYYTIKAFEESNVDDIIIVCGEKCVRRGKEEPPCFPRHFWTS